MVANHKMSFRVKVLGLSVAAALLAACGGGGGSGTSNSGTGSASISGKAVDFYLSGATVTFTGCGQTTTTDANGAFTVPAGCATSAFTVSGGTDIGTNLPFTGVLKSPAPAAGATTAIASPLTTLIANNPSIDLVAQLGLPAGANPLTTDPMTDAKSLQAAEVVQTLINQVSAALQKLSQQNGGSLTPAQAAAAASAALGGAIAANTGSTFSLTNTSNITSVLSAAVTNANNTAGAFNLPAGTSISSLASSFASAQATAISAQVSSVSTALANITIGANPAATLAALQSSGLTSTIGAAAGVTLTNYIQVASVTLNGGTAIPLAQVQASSTTPLSLAPALNDIQVSLKGVGASYAGQTVAVNAGFKYTLGTNVVNVIINNVQLTFNSSGVLTNATVPVGSTYSFSLSGAKTASANLTNNAQDSLFNSGNLDLSISLFLSKLSAAASLTTTQLAAYTPTAGAAVSASLTLSSATSNTVYVGDSSGQALNSVSVAAGSATVTGSGVAATIN